MSPWNSCRAHRAPSFFLGPQHVEVRQLVSLMNLVWPSKWEKPWKKRRSKPLDVGTSYIILPQTLMWANCSLILEIRIEVIAKCFQFRVTKISNLPASPQIEARLATIRDTCFVFVFRNITPKMKSEVLGMKPSSMVRSPRGRLGVPSQVWNAHIGNQQADSIHCSHHVAFRTMFVISLCFMTGGKCTVGNQCTFDYQPDANLRRAGPCCHMVSIDSIDLRLSVTCQL